MIPFKVLLAVLICFGVLRVWSADVPDGTYIRGDTYTIFTALGYADESPAEGVVLSAFIMDATEVQAGTWSQVCSYAQGHGYDLPSGAIYAATGSLAGASHPIAGISWYDAVKWCNARSEMEGLTPAYYTDEKKTNIYRSGMLDLSADCILSQSIGYRLPTETEWEAASRGGIPGLVVPWAERSNCYADVLSTTQANYAGSGALPAGQFSANGYGLYDMGGNVAEWCWDWYDATAYQDEAITNPTGAEQSRPLNARVTRGGSWFDNAQACRCSARSAARPADTNDFQGFRTVRNARLGVPAIVHVVPESDEMVLQWDAVPDGVSYDIWRTDPWGSSSVHVATTTNLNWTDTNVVADYRYGYTFQVSGTGTSSQVGPFQFPPLYVEMEWGIDPTSYCFSWAGSAEEVYTLYSTTNLMSGFQLCSGLITATPPQNCYTGVSAELIVFFSVHAEPVE